MQVNQNLYLELITWYQSKHSIALNNTPSTLSEIWLKQLINDVLQPLLQLGQIQITYGFVGYELNKFIQKNSPAGTCPKLDQHASCEVNGRHTLICDRPGAACDILITGYENRMHIVAQNIVQNLNYDRLYFYGRNRPLHVSVAPENNFSLQLMNTSAAGRRYPGKRACGTNAHKLAAEL